MNDAWAQRGDDIEDSDHLEERRLEFSEKCLVACAGLPDGAIGRPCVKIHAAPALRWQAWRRKKPMPNVTPPGKCRRAQTGVDTFWVTPGSYA